MPLSSAPRISVTPDHPTNGSLVIVRVEGGTGTPRGAIAGQPLHFEAGSAGYWTLAAVPLASRDSLLVHLTTDSGGADTTADTATIAIPVAARRRVAERLRVAERFLEPADSAVLDRVAKEREARLAAGLQSEDKPRLWQGRFTRPVTGRITDVFGSRREWNPSDTLADTVTIHEGVDLASPLGTPIHSANRGVVALIGDWYYGGKTIIVDHGGGLVTMYQHLSAAIVAVGDTVQRGQVLGRVGATGRVTGPHLHWGASYDTVLVDPLSLLDVRVGP